jgi:hypothetical protein
VRQQQGENRKAKSLFKHRRVKTTTGRRWQQTAAISLSSNSFNGFGAHVAGSYRI